MTTNITIPSKFKQPTIHQTAKTILEVCKDGDWFNSSMVRGRMANHFPETVSTILNAKIQPHLKNLIRLGAIKTPVVGQVKNKPYVIVDREKLLKIQNEECLQELVVQEQVYSCEDEMKSYIKNLEARVTELEDRLSKFLNCFEKAVF